KTEDLVKFGFESEFIGRLPVRCILETLSEEDLYSILKMPNNPVILSKRLDFNAYGIKIVFTDDALKLLAKRAYKENTGARGLISVIEEALLDFEEKLPSQDLLKFTVTKEVLEDPKGHLEDLLSKQNSLKWDDLYKKAFLDHKTYISSYIKDNWKTFANRYGLTLSQARCDMVALYFCNHVMEIEDAVKKIKKVHDSIKEIEVEVSKSYNLNIIFEEDAIDFLIEQFITHTATTEEILSKIYTNYYDGFNLIREKTGKTRFFLSKTALINHETYLNDLIREEIT
ncbi:MAG TPA: ATPase, partial [Desulfobacterales bacterium]|nr:ATPase [Desulfobacterales bacterium]